MSDSALEALSTTVAESLKARVSAMVDGDLDKDALCDVLARIKALKTLTRRLSHVEIQRREQEHLKGTLTAEEPSPQDADTLKERLGQADARLEHLATQRLTLTANLATLAHGLGS